MSCRVSILAAFAAAAIAALSAPDVHAQSKRDLAAAAVLQKRMENAEKHYRDAMLAEDEEAATTASSAALTEIKAVIEACARQKGCAMPDMLATYERLLKASPQPGEELFDDEAEDPIDEGDFTAADVPEQANAASLLSEEGKRFVQMVQFNPAVQAGIRRWLTDMRPQLMTSYENYRTMRHLMWPEFERRGLPEALLFGIMAKESNGRVHAVSRAGAAGPMQFMPATGRRFGLGPDDSGFDSRYDPRSAAMASAAYLNERLRQLNNDLELSLAGYNGGEGRALRVHRQSGGTGFWNASVYDQFPAETRDYVPMVIAAAWIYLHPRQYGVVFPKVDAQPAQLRLTRPASIYELTVCLGNSGNRDGYMRALRNLNPRYEAEAWIPAGTVLSATTRIVGLYHRHCEHGPRADLARALVTANVNAAIVSDTPAGNVAVGDLVSLPGEVAAPAPAPAKARARTHRVAKGDTLGRIAQRYDCEVKALARANGLKAPAYSVRQGQQLKLEGCGS